MPFEPSGRTRGAKLTSRPFALNVSAIETSPASPAHRRTRLEQRRHHRCRPVGLYAAPGAGTVDAYIHPRRGGRGPRGCRARRPRRAGHGGRLLLARARHRGRSRLEARAVAALRGVDAGAAEVILVVGGDATGLAGYGKIASNYNIATRDHLAPLGHGGPKGVYALVASRQMKTYGLEKSDYGRLAVAQRGWAAKNPFAVYRTPLTMDEYLAAPMVADPLSRYD